MSKYAILHGGAAFVALSAVGCFDGLVGGECARGFVETDGTCVEIPPDEAAGSVGSGPDATILAIDPSGGSPGGSGGSGGAESSSTATTSAAGAGSTGSAGGGGGCDAPLVACDGACTDLSSDPDNCGACGNACETGICIEGECSGGTVGHLVAIGMDYAAVSAGSPAAVLLGNAVLLPTADPVRVLQYRTYAEPAGQPLPGGVAALVEDEAGSRGRAVSWVEDTSAAQIAAKLLGGETDVLVVHDQDHAPSGMLGAIGAAWAPAIEAFAKSGGVVVVLATGAGTGQMDDLLTTAGILAVTDFTDVSGQPVDNIGWLDVLGQNVLSPFLAKPTSSSFVTAAVPDAMTSFVVTSAQAAPVAVHRVVLGD